MEKVFWRAKLREGMKEEYIRRHNEIWPDMVKALKEAGICNYTVKIADDSLLWVLSRDSYASYVQVWLSRAFHRVDGRAAERSGEAV